MWGRHAALRPVWLPASKTVARLGVSQAAGPLSLSLSLFFLSPPINSPSLHLHPLCPRSSPPRVLTSGSLSTAGFQGTRPRHLYSYGGSFPLLLCHHDCHPFRPPPPAHVFCLNSTLPFRVLQSPLAALSSSVSSSFLLNGLKRLLSTRTHNAVALLSCLSPSMRPSACCYM